MAIVDNNVFKDFHDVSFRILLVDDRIGTKEDGCKGETVFITDFQKSQLVVKQCKNIDCSHKQCKLCTIKRLMDDSTTNNGDNTVDGKKEIYTDIGNDNTSYFYWQEKNIDCYYCPTITKDFINDINFNFNDGIDKIALVEEDVPSSIWERCCRRIKGQNESSLEIHCSFEPTNQIRIDKNRRHSLNVQIVGVRDVRTALLLLSRYKFDMLFFDYLLDYKDENKAEREYSTQFFEFLSTRYEDMIEREVAEKKKQKYMVLAEFRRSVLDNRGPLDKLWIMPITGFNSPFITELQSKNVPLINTRWHIENGADPITTPWQFLVKLNQFIELQLKGCIYDQTMLLTFLNYTGKNLKRLYADNNGKPKCQFHAFQAFMGAEFSNFIDRYGARTVIGRDAMSDQGQGDSFTNKSMFSTYVWGTFYLSKDKEDEKKKKPLFALHNRMQIFYQVAATMPEDRNGVMRLRESFRRLRYYIEINNIYPKDTNDCIIMHKKEELDDGMSFIANCIDVLLVERGEKEDDKAGKKRDE